MLILRWKAPILLLLALVAAGSASGEDGHCLWYGVCGPPTTLGVHSNCLYNGTAPLLNDTKTLNTLADICPLLFEHTDGVRPIATCCDVDNVREMQQSLALIAVLFSRCPVCYYNFRKSVCQLSCSSRQSTFVQITSTKNDTTSGKSYVGGIKMYVHKNYTSGVFNSCKGVQNTQTNSPAINMMCGKWGWYRCNDVRLYEFLGHNSYAPFTIDYIITKETNFSGYEPYNPTMETCDKNFTSFTGEEVQSCSCTDCYRSCPVAPPIPPPAGDWMIGPLYGTAVVMIAVFLAIAVPFVCVFAVWHSRNAGASQLDNTAADDAAPYVQEMEASLIDRWGAVMELNMQRFFQRWGTFCASHPIPVLVIGLVLATSLSFGVVRLKITTDPIDLWASPSSRSRLEKDYFDSNFGPFYRTEMIIIRAKGLQSFNYSDGGGSTSEFGPAFNLSLLQAALQLQNHISENITAEFNNSTVRLRDICFRPLYPENQFCAIQSMLEYFQDDPRNLNRTSNEDNSSFNYLDHIKYCLLNPTEISDADFFQLPCLSKWGGPSSPFTVVGGFLAPGQTLHGGITYLNATALLITFLVENHNEPGRNQPAMAWEKAFLDYMAQYKHPHMDIAYYAERSIEDEIARESESDTSTVLISYLIMFAYISISLGQYNGSSRLLVDSKVTLGLGGVIIVLLSVLASLGVYGMLGVRGTLIVIEVIPFLVLAVGVDNIFILVQGYQRDRRQPGESLEQCVGRIVGDTAPSMLLSSFSESACFFLGALIDMPAVRAFALFAGLSLLIDFVLQITCFVSLMTLDARRQESSRFDVICCVRGSKKEQHQQEGILLRLFRNFYTPLLMQPVVRGAVLVAFLGWLCSSLAVLPYVQVGLDQEISMPEDSYVLKLFRYQQRYLSVGPPVYFVVRDGLDYSERRVQNAVCSSVGCDRHSVGAQIALAAQQPARTFVASAASNWLDDFYDWTLYGYDKSGNPTGDNACCFMHYSDHGFCPSAAGNSFDPNCTSCPMTFTPDHLRPDVASFNQYLPFFLQDNPGPTCPKGGHAAYGNAVRTASDAHNQTVVGASYFMAYHTILKTSSDYYSALDWARRIADNMTAVLKQVSPGCSDAQVFPYSIFYVFYEQYLTMWPDVLRALAISIFTIFLVTFFLLGLDLHSAFVILLMIVTILTNLGGLMYWWDISLNAVSLVNLVMAVGISVEFCSHITRAFAVSMQPTRVLRAAEALTNMGSSVLSGITLTKFGGIIVLGFAHSQIFRIFYFRMYLGVVLYGASHGLILLPVLLSFIGPGVSPYRLWFMRRHGSRLLVSSASHVTGQQPADPTEQHAVGEHSTLTHTPA